MLALLALLSAPQAPPSNTAVLVRAALPAAVLEVGALGHFTVHFELAPGWGVPANPLREDTSPGLFLQLAPPPELELSGPSATRLDELLRSAFLDLPFERVVAQGDTAIEFRVLRPLPEGARLAFNALIYVRADGAGAATRLVRLRFELPLRPGAEARSVSSADSSWGRADVLRIGQRAEPFELPTALGTTRALGSLLDRSFLVVTTQRSCL